MWYSNWLIVTIQHTIYVYKENMNASVQRWHIFFSVKIHFVYCSCTLFYYTIFISLEKYMTFSHWIIHIFITMLMLTLALFWFNQKQKKAKSTIYYIDTSNHKFSLFNITRNQIYQLVLPFNISNAKRARLNV